MVRKARKPSVMKHSKNGEQSWLTFQTERMMQQERGHTQTSIKHSNLCKIMCTRENYRWSGGPLNFY